MSDKGEPFIRRVHKDKPDPVPPLGKDQIGPRPFDEKTAKIVKVDGDYITKVDRWGNTRTSLDTPAAIDPALVANIPPVEMTLPTAAAAAGKAYTIKKAFPETGKQAQPKHLILRCNNASCRIETFKGALTMPLNTCPICVSPATPTP